jgi:hypothetical protein
MRKAPRAGNLRTTLRRAQAECRVPYCLDHATKRAKCYDCIEGLCGPTCRSNYLQKVPCAWCNGPTAGEFCGHPCFKADQAFWASLE